MKADMGWIDRHDPVQEVLAENADMAGLCR
jgi:hypothetical protein